MENFNLIETFSEFKNLKNIDINTMKNVLEEVFKSQLLKQYGADADFDVIVNIDKGDLEIWRNRTIVEDADLENENTQISLSSAKLIDDTYEVGEEVTDKIEFKTFGRRSVLSLRQNLASRILDLEKLALYQKYKERVGQIVVGEVYQNWKKETLILDDEQNELILPKSEQIPTDFMKKGDAIRAVVLSVDWINSIPKIILSRTSPLFLERLFELEVPEIFDGLITIKKIVRAPGERAKVAVESYDERVDPVGACVGMRGSRIHGIVRELRNENIDVVNWTSNLQLFVQRALNPAKVLRVNIVEEEQKIFVFVHADERKLAIGKNGLNIKLASQLVGYEIEVYAENEDIEEDVDLEEFIDEIDDEIIDKFQELGLETAKSVLSLSIDELVQKTGFGREVIEEVVSILKSEFEEE